MADGVQEGVQAEPTIRTRIIMARDLGVAPTEQAPAIAVTSGDNVRWGAIWAGFFVTIVLTSILYTIPTGFSVNPHLYITNSWWWVWDVASIVMSTFVGGMVAGYQAGVYNQRSAAINGAVLGTFVVGIGLMTVLGYETLTVGLHRSVLSLLPATGGAAVGPSWAWIFSVIAIVLGGFGGALVGLNLRERIFATTAPRR